ncbi:type II toxin-antitoxin system RelE/ParE family toxin [Patescibacteria group bacterium]|nr:type II toxin-antitoxin system RelE/ParE family toxin [Patescibacteria group bacterium]MBU1685361.1 type II toxin-antitoxin system RelE/ParE family toxin [Patescibacteria group bacterium]MBU1864737.1 type II toxin-antitoxin system RelE/ParE family toxin [Candidatus Omnitrophota bacterium]
MIFRVIYHESVVKSDIEKLSATDKKRIKFAIETKLMTDPAKFGKPLRKSLKGYRKLRSGDYRIIFRINEEVIRILTIEHRSIVYKKGMERLKN